MPAWFHRRLFIKMSQHNIACFRIYFEKYNPILFDFIKNDLGCIFPLTVFHHFRVFPFHQLGCIVLKSDKYISYLDDFIPVLNQPYQRGNLIDLANDYFIVSSCNQSPNLFILNFALVGRCTDLQKTHKDNSTTFLSL
jgi:hypothetical protein